MADINAPEMTGDEIKQTQLNSVTSAAELGLPGAAEDYKATFGEPYTPQQTTPFNNLAPSVEKTEVINDGIQQAQEGFNFVAKEQPSLAAPANPTPGDTTSAYTKNYDNDKLSKLMKGAQDTLKSAEIKSPAAPEDPTAVKSKQDEANPDPLAVRIFRDVSGSSPLVSMENGLRGFAQVTLESLDEVAIWLNTNVVDLDTAARDFNVALGGASEGLGFNANLGAGGPGEDRTIARQETDIMGNQVNPTITDSAVEGITQFSAAFVPILGQVRALSGGKAVTWGAKTIETMYASGLAGVLAFDDHEARLSNLVAENSETLAPVAEYLAASPDDTTAEAMFKNFTENVLLGGLGEAAARLFGAGVKTLKANRQRLGPTKGIEPDPTKYLVPAIRQTKADGSTVTVAGQKGNFHSDVIQNQVNEAIPVPEGQGIRVEDIVPAIRSEGQVHVGTQADGHEEIAKRIFTPNPERPLQEALPYERGFVDKEGNFITPEELETRMDVQAAQDGAMIKREKAFNDAAASIEDTGGAGFVDVRDGTFYTREQAAKLAKVKDDTIAKDTTVGDNGPELGAMHLDDMQKAAQEPVPTPLGDPEAKFIPDEVGKAYNEGKATLKDILDNINWAQVTSVGNLDEAMDRIAKLVAKEIGDSPGEDVVAKYAKELGLSEDVFKAQGLQEDVARMLASEAVINASRANLVKLANLARESLDEGVLHAVYRMINIHKGITSRIGVVADSIHAVRAARFADGFIAKGKVPKGSRAQQVSDMSANLVQAGGAEEVRRLANAVAEAAITDKIRVRGNKLKRPRNAVDQVIKRGTLKTMGDMINEYWYFALLSNPGTHIVNATSNLMNAAYQVPVRALAAQIGKLRGTPGGVQVGEATELLYGYFSGLDAGLRNAKQTFLTGKQSDIFNKIDGDVIEPAITGENFGFAAKAGDPKTLAGQAQTLSYMMGKAMDMVGAGIRTPGRALMTADEFFRTTGQTASLRAQALRIAKGQGLEGTRLSERMMELLNNPTDEMMDEALDFTRQLTFTEKMGKVGGALQSISNIPVVGKLAIPFVRTPVSLLKWAQRNSPLGLLSRKVWGEMTGGGAKSDIAIAKMALGTGISLLVAQQTLAGNLTGSGPVDPELKAIWKLTHQPNSIKIGDTWYSYNRFDPFGLVASLSSTVASTMGGAPEEEWSDYVTAVATAMSDSMSDKAFLGNIADMLNAFNEPDRYAERFLQKTIGTLIMPAGASASARTLDNVWREVTDIESAIIARTPGLSDTLPAHRNIWGQKIYSESLGPNIISPLYTMTPPDASKEPISYWLYDNEVTVGMPSRKQMGVEMTPQEYDKFVEMAGNGLKDPSTGKGLYDTLNAIMTGKHSSSGEWNRATDGPEGGRAYMVKHIINTYREAAINKMAATDKTFADKVRLAQLTKLNNMTKGPEGQ